jgi:hypothetical protein
VLVTLAPGADPNNVLQVLFNQKTTVGNHYGDLPRYLDWALTTAQLLRNQIRQSDIDRLIFTPRLWQLQELTGRNDRFTNHLLSMELVEKSDVFEQVCAALEAEIGRWNPADAALVVLDTSVFIHHRYKIREIDYAAITGARAEPVRLVVPRVVIDELDRLKESGNQAVRWRAGHTLGVLDELLTSPKGRAIIRGADNITQLAAADGVPRGRVTIEVFSDDARHVRLADNDDEIIDRALALQAYAGRPVRLLTMDTSMALQARMLDLRVHKETKDIGEEPTAPAPKPSRREVAPAAAR